MPMRYIKYIKDDEHSDYMACSQYADWIVSDFTSTSLKDGFILQHFSRAVDPALEYLKNTDYFEAWQIVDGRNEDSGEICDDIFAVGQSLTSVDDFHNSLEIKGTIEFCGDVFWIPKGIELYDIIDNWSSTAVREAGGLRACFEFPEFTPELRSKYHVFTRKKFTHHWDLSSERSIYNAVYKFMFKRCPHGPINERECKEFNSSIDTVLSNSTYNGIKKRITEQWYMFQSNKNT